MKVWQNDVQCTSMIQSHVSYEYPLTRVGAQVHVRSSALAGLCDFWQWSLMLNYLALCILAKRYGSIHIYPARKCACVITIYRNDNIFPLHHNTVRLLWYPESFLSFSFLPAFQSTALNQCSQRQRTGLQRRTDTEARCIFSVAKLWFQW